MRATADIVNLTIRRIEQRLGKTLEIPPLSPTAQKILLLTEVNGASLADDQLSRLCSDLQLGPSQARHALDRVMAAEQALRLLSEQFTH